MRQENDFVILAAYRCTECQDVRAYGTKLPDLTNYTGSPLLKCEGCARLTRHEPIGMREFPRTIERACVSGHLVIISRILPIEAAPKPRRKDVAPGGSVQ